MEYIHTFMIGIMTLFPVINPIGSGLISDPLMGDVNRKISALKVAIYSFIMCVVGLILGKYIIELFGVSIPIIKIVGGLVVANIGWNSLNGNNNSNNAPSPTSPKGKNFLFYPITFPITIGGGVLAILFTLSAHISVGSLGVYLLNLMALILSIAVNCAIIFILYWKVYLINKFGNSFQTILNKIISFIIIAVGAQISYSGVLMLDLFK